MTFFDKSQGLPLTFLTQTFNYSKYEAPTMVRQCRNHQGAKARLLMASRVWPAHTDFARLTRRVEQAQSIRRGRSYRTIKRRRGANFNALRLNFLS